MNLEEELAWAMRSKGLLYIRQGREYASIIMPIVRRVQAEAWNEALAHVERLSDPASTINIYPERELITLADVTQAREENPYTKENNA